MNADLESVKRVLLELKDEAKRMRKEQLGARLAPKGQAEPDGEVLEQLEGGPEEEVETAEVEMPATEGESETGESELEEAADADPAMEEAAATAGGDEDVKLLFQKLGLRR